MERSGRPSGSGVDRRPSSDAAFRFHLTVYLVFALFVFSLYVLMGILAPVLFNVLFFWVWLLLLHAFVAFRGEAPGRVGSILRGLLPGRAATPSASAQPPEPPRGEEGTPGRASSLVSIDDAEERVARLWRVARRIPTEAARERAFRVCAAADRVAEVLAQDKADPQLVGWFVERHLAPTEALLERYTRLAQRRVAAAEPALERVEEHDLPLLESRLDALYQQLHRGDVVDLAVASEMLKLGGLDDRPPEPSRRSST